MAIKKKAPAKTAKKAAPKKPAKAFKAPAKKKVTRSKSKATKKGDFLTCQVCGMTVVVTENCSCGVCDLICCDTPMVFEM